MKQAKLLALTISLVILCGCSASAKYEEMFQIWRADFLALEAHEIEAVVTASDADTVCDYTLLYTAVGEIETVEVLAPELIAKVRASIEKGETRLSFDGVMLETGSELTGNLSPLTSLPHLMEMLREGHLESSWREHQEELELVVTELEMPDGAVLCLWQESGDMRPVYAEIRGADRTEIKLVFTKLI